MLYFILKLRCYFNIYFIFDNNYENNIKKMQKKRCLYFRLRPRTEYRGKASTNDSKLIIFFSEYEICYVLDFIATFLFSS